MTNHVGLIKSDGGAMILAGALAAVFVHLAALARHSSWPLDLFTWPADPDDGPTKSWSRNPRRQ
jgi:hypothetical protein